MRIPELKTDRLLLNAVTRADAAAIFAYASDPEVSKWVNFVTHQAIADAYSFVEYLEGQSGTDFTFAIRLVTDGTMIGGIDFSVDAENRADLHFCLSRDHWNRGIVTEAARRVLAWGCASFPKVEKVFSGAVVGNIGSCRVLEKCGFVKTGTKLDTWEKYADPLELYDYELVVKR